MMAAVQFYGGHGLFTRFMVSFVVCMVVGATVFKGNLDQVPNTPPALLLRIPYP